MHVYIETFLLLLAAYILLFKRQYDPAKKYVGQRRRDTPNSAHTPPSLADFPLQRAWGEEACSSLRPRDGRDPR